MGGFGSEWLYFLCLPVLVFLGLLDEDEDLLDAGECFCGIAATAAIVVMRATVELLDAALVLLRRVDVTGR